LPSSRSVAVGCTLLAVAGGAYLVALDTSIFAVRKISVTGAPRWLAARIRATLGPIEGTSLVSFSQADAERRLIALPQIASVAFDRDFPHTLRVKVSVEKAVVVLRKGSEGWLASSSGRVLAALGAGPYPALPRLWLPAATDVSVGGSIEAPQALQVAAALRGARLPHVLAVRGVAGHDLVVELVGGRELRLGDASNLALKLAVAAAILPRAEGARYVDVSVPARVVAGYDPTSANSQPSG
jgi:cell division protein FtsQ